MGFVGPAEAERLGPVPEIPTLPEEAAAGTRYPISSKGNFQVRRCVYMGGFPLTLNLITAPRGSREPAGLAASRPPAGSHTGQQPSSPSAAPPDPRRPVPEPIPAEKQVISPQCCPISFLGSSNGLFSPQAPPPALYAD